MQTKQTEPLLKDEEKDQHTPLSNQPLVSLLTRPLPLTSREINGIFFAFFLPSLFIGCSEFTFAGLLPPITNHFGISYTQATAGTFVYAFTVAGTGLPITALTLNRPPKKTLLTLMSFFVAGSVTSALAPNFPVLILGRILSAIPHAPFFAISFAIANSMLPGEEATSIPRIYLGLAASNIAGTPAITALGQLFGWQFPFWLLAGIGTIGFVIMMGSPVHKVTLPSTTLRQELLEFKEMRVLGGSVAIGLGFGGMAAFYAYIAPIMIEVAKFHPSALSWIIAIFGTGLCFGNYAGGKLTNRALAPTLYGSLIGLSAILAGMVFIVRYPIPSVLGGFAIGAFGFGMVAPSTSNVTQGAQPGSLLIRASTNVSFNAGIAFCVWATGRVIDRGFGYESACWTGAAFTFFGFIMAAASRYVTPERVSSCCGMFKSIRNSMSNFFGFGRQQNPPEIKEIYISGSIQVRSGEELPSFT